MTRHSIAAWPRVKWELNAHELGHDHDSYGIFCALRCCCCYFPDEKMLSEIQFKPFALSSSVRKYNCLI